MLPFALLLALAAAAVAVSALAAARDELRALRWYDAATLLGATALGVVVSLSAFDAVGHHAFRAHEEQLFAIFTGAAPRESYHPAEVQLLLGWIYEQVGLRIGTSTRAFVATAMVLGAGGPLLAGLAGRIATGRWVGGALPALLLALQPTLAYWRIHAYHVAPAHAAFCACLLAAVLVVRTGARSAYTAWFLLGALAAFLRLDLGPAVACTAALPLLGGRAGDLKRPGLWLPGLLAAGLLFALPESALLSAVEQREDYRMGTRFLALHGPILARLAVGPWGGGLMLAGLAALGVALPERHRTATALVVVAAAIAAPLGFIDFGTRHTLASATAIYLAAGAGLATLQDRRPRAAIGAGALCVLVLAIPWAGRLQDLGARYSTVPPDPPTLPGVATPTADFPPGWNDCAIYSNVQAICDTSPNCHPVKDLRDPALVRARWDDYSGCVLWTVDATYDEVAGVQHEWWPILRELYPCAPAGRLDVPGQGEVHLYRILKRP